MDSPRLFGKTITDIFGIGHDLTYQFRQLRLQLRSWIALRSLTTGEIQARSRRQPPDAMTFAYRTFNMLMLQL